MRTRSRERPQDRGRTAALALIPGSDSPQILGFPEQGQSRSNPVHPSLGGCDRPPRDPEPPEKKHVVESRAWEPRGCPCCCLGFGEALGVPVKRI